MYDSSDDFWTPAPASRDYYREERILVALRIIAAIVTSALVLALAIGDARAASPPAGSDDAAIMGPYADWVTRQTDDMGRNCCDISDGRPVEARIDGDHWAVHIVPQQWSEANTTRPGPSVNNGMLDHWLTVPNDKIKHGANPTGHPILWLYQGRVQCFAPPDVV